MNVSKFNKSHKYLSKGTTLLELIITLSILVILTASALPLATNTIKSRREADLRQALREIRNAIDRYKEFHDRSNGQSIPIEEKTLSGYPKNLEILYKGFIPAGRVNGKKLYFLRRLPEDPMTGTTEWGIRAADDDPDSNFNKGEDVFDVYTKSEGTALNGTKYRTW